MAVDVSYSPAVFSLHWSSSTLTICLCRTCRNPYFGTARRAATLEKCLRRSPKRGLHIRKLIFGEGSSTDIMDWVTKHNVPNLLRAAPNVQVVGMGGLKNVHLDDFKDALHTRAMLEEVRACGKRASYIHKLDMPAKVHF